MRPFEVYMVPLSNMGFIGITYQHGNFAERNLYFVLYFLSQVIWSMFIGAICGAIANTDPFTKAYRAAMEQLNHFLRENHAPLEFRLRAREYVRSSRDLRKKNAFTQLFAELSPKLRNDAAAICAAAQLKSVKVQICTLATACIQLVPHPQDTQRCMSFRSTMRACPPSAHPAVSSLSPLGVPSLYPLHLTPPAVSFRVTGPWRRRARMHLPALAAARLPRSRGRGDLAPRGQLPHDCLRGRRSLWREYPHRGNELWRGHDPILTGTQLKHLLHSTQPTLLVTPVAYSRRLVMEPNARCVCLLSATSLHAKL